MDRVILATLPVQVFAESIQSGKEGCPVHPAEIELRQKEGLLSSDLEFTQAGLESGIAFQRNKGVAPFQVFVH